MADLVRVSRVDDGIFRIQIDDPECQNRLSESLCRALGAAFESLCKAPDLKVVLFAGRRDVFCAGATLEGLRELASGKAQVRDMDLTARMLEFPVPIVGVLEGHAVGGGLFLALACDLVVASESSRYSANPASMGFTPGMGSTALLPALVGHHFASEMMLTAKFYKGRELKGRGLFNHIVPVSEVEALALDLARRIAEKPRYVLELTKETLNLSRRQALQQAVSREHLMYQMCFAQPEVASLIETTYVAQDGEL